MQFKSNLFFNWGVGDHWGWGVYGFNLLYWSMIEGDLLPVPIVWPPSFRYPQDPITHGLIKQAESKWQSGIEAKDGDIMLSALGNTINKQSITKKLHEVGVIFFETNPLPKIEQCKLCDFELVIAGSSWNQNALLNMGINNSVTVIQGVNHELFKPRAKKVFRDRFVVFSGGKLEYRKGQDILLRAFSIFAKKHSDALLITSWRSDWEKEFSESVNKSNLCSDLRMGDNFNSSVGEWIEKNGVSKSQYLILDSISNSMMANVYPEADVAIFPNRCEGGTNLVAMEAISSGLTCIISANTGHLDIIKDGNCIPLSDQKLLTSDGVFGWGESSVDEIVSHLESIYDHGLLNKDAVSSSLAGYSWEKSIKLLRDTIKSHTNSY